MTSKTREKLQKELCNVYGSDFLAAPRELKVGISLNVREGIVPINGLRHPPVGDTTGWYIYAGEEMSIAPDFFQPLHVEHLSDWCPEVEKYLGLSPGWRFLIAGDYEDVWYDETLLDT
ncbi:immunity protein Imm33 domain-containing protein [Pseudoalteromonas luteoviolacea]|uniref:Imm33-like domain-containing protein n=1 Tax=Pseudoalteromonas luteoviolacea H33 TaxID=1365251 RepID=A0A167EJZ6_9GAMM|nr:hypothetical protein [Pseudoalteromonas luteoviolacea]KZN50869.1 hypothetical protein N476_14605 [Pseudoalteromonas luteoviolacea H33]KZN75541.1 hypothetical protein N477_18525 [Pseudoalteromonas luteoviolacea H33-S]